MSNPYAPKNKKPAPMSTEPPEADPSLQSGVDPVGEAPEGTINEIMEWVGEDQDKAQKALDAELADKGRKTLIDRLEEVLGE